MRTRNSKFRTGTPEHF